jgi:hypothetical protein
MNLICFLVFVPFGLIAIIFSLLAIVFRLFAISFEGISENLAAAADFVAEYGFSITGSLVDIFEKKKGKN